jgi:RTX calcium-binding nonapeptide repeat (4 copies)
VAGTTLFGGAGDDSMTGDSVAFVGDATGAGDDVLMGGPGVEFLLGDSEAFVGNAIRQRRGPRAVRSPRPAMTCS